MMFVASREIRKMRLDSVVVAARISFQGLVMTTLDLSRNVRDLVAASATHVRR